MNMSNLKKMPTDQLWEFHAQVGSLLVKILTAEKRDLELKLGKLRADAAPPHRNGRGAITLRCVPSIGIRKIPHRPGQAVARHRGGLKGWWKRAKALKTCELPKTLEIIHSRPPPGGLFVCLSKILLKKPLPEL